MSKIYLISPPKIDVKNFLPRLTSVLKTGFIPVFQLRLKECDKKEIIKISYEIKKICHDNGCLFLLNDFSEIAFEVGADGVHVGSDDGSILEIRKKSPKEFIIGASCYDSKELAINAFEQQASYISFGTFFSSSTKNSQGKPSVDIITWANKTLNISTAAIGGINDGNCLSLVDAGVNFLSVISYVWNNPLGEVTAIKKLNMAIKNRL